jgi:DNA polymerase/3'-5' exonuclease PolX
VSGGGRRGPGAPGPGPGGVAPAPKTRFPLRHAARLAEDLAFALSPACERIAVAGSVRRASPDVADIEIVAAPRFAPSPDLFGGGAPRNLLWEALDAKGASYERAGDKYRRFVWRGTPVDLFTCRPGNFGWILVMRTGSAAFSRHMAVRLNAAGYTSSEGWVARTGAPGPIETPEEADVFALAGEPFIPPVARSW